MNTGPSPERVVHQGVPEIAGPGVREYTAVEVAAADGTVTVTRAGARRNVAQTNLNRVANVQLLSVVHDVSDSLAECDEWRLTSGLASPITMNLRAARDGAVWWVYNATEVTVTVKVVNQTGIAVASTKRAILGCGPTDVCRWTADV